MRSWLMPMKLVGDHTLWWSKPSLKLTSSPGFSSRFSHVVFLLPKSDKRNMFRKDLRIYWWNLSEKSIVQMMFPLGRTMKSLLNTILGGIADFRMFSFRLCPLTNYSWVMLFVHVQPSRFPGYSQTHGSRYFTLKNMWEIWVVTISIVSGSWNNLYNKLYKPSAIITN